MLFRRGYLPCLRYYYFQFSLNVTFFAAYNCHDTTDRFLRNTKAIVFYSTPHNGSRIANLNSPTSYVVLPSVEVQELREGGADA